MTPRREPTLGELMADPLVRAMMTADHVDPHALEAMFRSLAPQVANRQRPQTVLWPRPRFDRIDAPSVTPSAAVKPAGDVCGSICAW